ncbi:hypothetical protein ACOCHS_06235 [Propionibacteriaceae bacterium Y2011]
MEWGIVGAAVVAIVIGAWQMWKRLAPDVRAERTEERRLRRRDKRRLGRAYDWGDMAERFIYESRTDRRRHDDKHHPDGDGIGVTELPPELRHGIRTWASQGEDDDE